MEIIKLNPDEEVKIEFESQNEKVRVQLTSGSAEYFGIELIKNKVYTFNEDEKGSIFTFDGCELMIESKISKFEIIKNPSMATYKNTNNYLEKLREDARIKKEVGPIVIVCGSRNCGKIGVIKFLANYALNSGSKPIYVDLDCGQSITGIPGSIGYFLKEKSENLNCNYIKSYNLHFGYKQPFSNFNFYSTLVKQLSEEVYKKLKEDPIIKKSGMIIKTNGWVDNFGFRCLLYVIKKFEADIVLTIDNEVLNEKLDHHLKQAKIFNVPKSSGVPSENSKVRKKKRDNRLFKYFYEIKQDSNEQQILTYFFKIPIDQIEIYKVFNNTKKPGKNQPNFHKFDNINSFELKKIKLLPTHLNHLLAVASTSDLKKIYKSNMKDFICIKNINLEKNQLTVISPQNQKLDLSCIFIISDIQFIDK